MMASTVPNKMAGASALQLICDEYVSSSDSESEHEVSKGNSISSKDVDQHSKQPVASDGSSEAVVDVVQDILKDLVSKVSFQQGSGDDDDHGSLKDSLMKIDWSSHAFTHRNEDAIDIDDSDSSSSSSSWSFSDSELEDEDLHEKKLSKAKPLSLGYKNKGEMDVYDLPPIQKLSISAKVEDLVHIGRVSSIVDCLVVVQSFKHTNPLDLDSVLFFKSGEPIGQVFDVIGPVAEPLYCIRFNTKEEISSLNIKVDMPIYYAPSYEAPVTKFVFVEKLRQEQGKGSDASWKHNHEPPDEIKEYSDDEEERRASQKHRAKTRLPPGASNGPASQPSAETHSNQPSRGRYRRQRGGNRTHHHDPRTTQAISHANFYGMPHHSMQPHCSPGNTNVSQMPFHYNPVSHPSSAIPPYHQNQQINGNNLYNIFGSYQPQ